MGSIGRRATCVREHLQGKLMDSKVFDKNGDRNPGDDDIHAAVVQASPEQDKNEKQTGGAIFLKVYSSTI
jgi:hypothetical protein